ncbi:MAG: YceI family protein, partial [Bacteroidota bacterium]
MKQAIILSGVAAMLSLFTASAQQTKWVFDKTHSKVQFDVAHLVISEVSGQFKEYNGTVLSDKPDFFDAKIDFTIDVKSISTDDEKRDGHLQSEDFFDVAKYPQITFKSKSIKKSVNNQYKLSGEL